MERRSAVSQSYGRRIRAALVGLFAVATAVVGADAEAFREDARVRGNVQAPVTIIEYSDFTCGFCAKFFRETFPMLQARYIDTGKVRYYYRDYPRADQGPGMAGALASRCASDQGKFWPMHDRLFSDGSQLDIVSLMQDARQLGLNERTFQSCLRDGAHIESIFADREEGRRWGFRGTPGFVILLSQDMQGRQTAPVTVPGAFPFDVFQTQIEEFLQRGAPAGSTPSSVPSGASTATVAPTRAARAP